MKLFVLMLIILSAGINLSVVIRFLKTKSQYECFQKKE